MAEEGDQPVPPRPELRPDGQAWQISRAEDENLAPRVILKLRATPSEKKQATVLAEIERDFSLREARPLFTRFESSARKAKTPFALAFKKRGMDRIYRLDLASGADPRAIAKALAARPEVEFAEPVWRYEAQALTNDPFLQSSGSWGQGEEDLWGLHRIQAPAAWDLATGAGVVVAVLDSGSDFFHADLSSNLWSNADEVPGNGFDDDDNGFVDDVRGWDFWDRDGDPQDENGHGTHVAGTVAAVGNNGEGVVGVAWGAQVMTVQVLDEFGFGFSDGIAEGILYAANNGAQVINMSLGSRFFSQVMEESIRLAHELGVTVVAAAGNSDRITAEFFPASSRYVIAVGASDVFDEKPRFSNFGNGTDLVAPGGNSRVSNPSQPHNNILSTLSSTVGQYGLDDLDVLTVGERYVRIRGTSMAAPHVAGVAALLLERFPGASNEEIRQMLRRSARDLGEPGWQEASAYGLLDADAAVRSTVRGSARLFSPRPETLNESTLQIAGLVDVPSLRDWTLSFGVGPEPTEWTELARGTTALDGALTQWNAAEVPDGDYTLRLEATDQTGELFEDRLGLGFDRVAILEPVYNLAHRKGDLITISGRAAGGAFDRYRVEIRDSQTGIWSTDGVTLIDEGLKRVAEGPLAIWDSSRVGGAGFYDVRLTVERVGLPDLVREQQFIVDPTLVSGWPQTVNRGFLAITDHLVAADVDLDGRSELLVSFGDDLHIYQADGTELPGWPQSVTDAPFAAIQVAPSVADLDGDGDQEVFVGTSSNYLFIWHHDGTRVEGWPLRYGRNAIAVDLDGDGRQQILSRFFVRNQLRLFDIDGRIAPGWPVFLPTDEVSAPAIGDLDGDGLQEIVVVGVGGAEGVYVLHQDGSFMAGWPVALDTENFLSSDEPALADLDLDGRPEIVVVDNFCEVHVFNAEGQLLPGWPQSLSSDHYTCNSPTVGDVTGDGRPEIVLGGAERQTNRIGPSILMVWDHTGEPLPGWPRRHPYPDYIAGFNGYGTAAIADADGDGRNDIIVDRTTDGRRPVAVDALDAQGRSLPGFPKPTSESSAWPTNTPAVADFDGDGLQELSYINRLGDIYLWDLPSQATDPAMSWPMYRHDQHQSGGIGTFRGSPQCVADETTLCLNQGRFKIEVDWRDFEGKTGTGRAMELTDDTGTFWFFNADNLELMVKVLDGRSINGHFWVFYGSLSNVEFSLEITDLETGEQRSYVNVLGSFASRGDIEAFAATPSLTASAVEPDKTQAQVLSQPLVDVVGDEGTGTGGCSANSTQLCLNQDRFEVSITWRDCVGNTGAGHAFPLSADTGSFWFFDAENLEVVIKVLDGRTINGRFWVFYGALSNVEYQITVRDTQTGEVKVYENPLGTFGSFGDTNAF